MGSRCVYLFSLVAVVVCLIGGRGRAFAFPVSTEQPPPSTEASILFDYSAEKYIGWYTGNWVANTLTTFDRVPAVIEYNYLTHTERLLNFVDELTADELAAVENNPYDWVTYTYRSIQYARDYRNPAEEHLGNSQYYFLEIEDSNENEDEQTYPKNHEAVWQIEIPKDHTAIVVLTSISLEKHQDGSCINDFVSVYTDDEVPDKFCSKLEQIRQLGTEGAERLTIRFQSNEENNVGGFAGGVWVYHDSNFADQPSRRDISLAEEPIAVAEEVKNAQLKEDDMDLPEIEQAVTCLVHIAKYGEKAAKQYISEAPNANCKDMAEAFRNRKYAQSSSN